MMGVGKMLPVLVLQKINYWAVSLKQVSQLDAILGNNTLFITNSFSFLFENHFSVPVLSQCIAFMNCKPPPIAPNVAT